VLVLDHLFVCVDPDPPELGELRRLGLTSNFSRTHVGQGTSNELVLFEENYLELLFVSDRGEAHQSLVRLDRRCEWRTTGSSPFGIALRGPRSSVGPDPVIHYPLEGMSGGLWIVQRTLQDARLPLVILVDRSDPHGAGPAQQGYASELFTHACGADAIGSVEFDVPGWSESMEKLPLPSNVNLRAADAPHASIALCGAALEGRRVGPLMTFV